MKIAIDISPILYGTGVSIYTKNLVENLIKINNENEYVLFGGSLRRQNELKDFANNFNKNVTGKISTISPTLADLLWNRLHILTIERLIGNVDLVHTSDWSEPPAKAKKVTTIHDLSPLKFPKLTHPKILSVHKRKLAWVREESNKIIVPSEATKKDLIELDFNEDKIVVIPEAVSDDIKSASKKSIEAVKKKYKVSGGYLLTVGINPRKNSERIIKAFEQVKGGKDLKLIMVGRPTYINLDEERDIRITGHISGEELVSLYTGAEAFLYPSLYEGFGLPILEAMACATPVVTSNISSMPEVAGDAAILVDPYSHESIAEGIKKAMRRRKSLEKKGKENLKRFSWEITAKKTLDVYKQALE